MLSSVEQVSEMLTLISFLTHTPLVAAACMAPDGQGGPISGAP